MIYDRRCAVTDPAFANVSDKGPVLEVLRDPGLARDLASNLDPALDLSTDPEPSKLISWLGPRNFNS